MIHVINGPNLNMLGKREPDLYGIHTLDYINAEIKELASLSNTEITFLQSNHEGEIIDYMQKVGDNDAVVLNAGGLSHTSVSIRDCIASISAPVIEVHISNIFARETFRNVSLLSPVCRGLISGLGEDVYKLAVKWCIERE